MKANTSFISLVTACVTYRTMREFGSTPFALVIDCISCQTRKILTMIMRLRSERTIPQPSWGIVQGIFLAIS
jgi:hypothetical protein